MLDRFGDYCMFMWRVIAIPDKWKVFFKRYLNEIYKLGIDSIPLIIIVSLFIGSLCTILIKLNISNPLLPRYTVGLTTREIILLEFSSTILCLILSGKIGSNIASEIGTMRATEQIDALEVMGINPASHLVLPKVIASLIVNPVLIIYSICFALLGGYITIILSESVSPYDFMDGLTYCFRVYDIIYAVTKTFVFAFIMSTISSFYGYRIEGGALELGKASTQGIVVSCFLILVINVLITQIML